ncbi:hypothetical protein WR25_07115 [Diploscapter pachys]|uniref:C2H2-type domain-containing protein n=1 Tax=Diploscapter pachys TaxID=2018661 RepID=A0A2A2JF92_9BILA|nr:hypothetical protein WR25_07115 [Diploscapter pachys]
MELDAVRQFGMVEHHAHLHHGSSSHHSSMSMLDEAESSGGNLTAARTGSGSTGASSVGDEMAAGFDAAISSLFPGAREKGGGCPVRRRGRCRGERGNNSIKTTCKKCGQLVVYSPNRIWNLMRHIWIMHDCNKPFKCSQCDYSHIKTYLIKHIATHHGNVSGAHYIDMRNPQLDAEWNELLDECFGTTYRKWKRIGEGSSESSSAMDYSQEHEEA